MHASRNARSAMVSLFAALSMVLVLVPLAGTASADRDAPNNACDAATPPAAFADRGDTDPAHRRNLDCIASHGITEGRTVGDQSFYMPLAPVRRDQMASFVARTLEAAERELPPPSDQGFEDIDGNPHADRINQLAEVGIVEGVTPDRYDPNGLVDRAQMASYIMRAAGFAHDATYEPVGGPYFDDTAGNVHQPNIASAYELWVVHGQVAASVYAPSDHVSREQMASYLSRFLDLIHPDIWSTSNQTFIVAPQEVRTAPTGTPIEFSIGARYDGEDFTGPVDLALFPCDNADATDSPVTFQDADMDGLADDIASSDADRAYFSAVNGAPTQGPEQYVSTVYPGDDGVLHFTVVAGTGPDCAVIVAFTDRHPAGELRLDAGHRPANPFGVGQAIWE